jgi:hypothetical protein
MADIFCPKVFLGPISGPIWSGPSDILNILLVRVPQVVQSSEVMLKDHFWRLCGTLNPLITSPYAVVKSSC